MEIHGQCCCCLCHCFSRRRRRSRKKMKREKRNEKIKAVKETRTEHSLYLSPSPSLTHSKTGLSSRLWNWRRFFGFPCQTFRFIGILAVKMLTRNFRVSFSSTLRRFMAYQNKKGNLHWQMCNKNEIASTRKKRRQLWLNYEKNFMFYWRFRKEFRRRSALCCCPNWSVNVVRLTEV